MSPAGIYLRTDSALSLEIFQKILIMIRPWISPGIPPGIPLKLLPEIFRSNRVVIPFLVNAFRIFFRNYFRDSDFLSRFFHDYWRNLSKFRPKIPSLIHPDFFSPGNPLGNFFGTPLGFLQRFLHWLLPGILQGFRTQDLFFVKLLKLLRFLLNLFLPGLYQRYLQGFPQETIYDL